MFTELPTSGLVVLLGAPASGKSTFADLAFARGDVIATDDIRGLAGGSRDALEATPESIDILYTIVRHRLRIGLFTVVDSTGTTEGLLGRLADLAEATSSPIHYIHVEAPVNGYSQFDVMSGAELGVHAARRAALRRRIRAL